MGDNISTVEGIQYSGGRVLMSTCLAIKKGEKISILFLYYETKFSFGSYENSSRFHTFLQLHWRYSRAPIVSANCRNLILNKDWFVVVVAPLLDITL